MNRGGANFTLAPPPDLHRTNCASQNTVFVSNCDVIFGIFKFNGTWWGPQLTRRGGEQLHEAKFTHDYS